MVQATYPGVYLQEISSGVRTITGVATSITAFIGYTARGLDHRAKRLFSFADYERAFGGLSADSELSYAVQQFFANGGGEAVVVRVPKNANADTIKAATKTATDTAAARDAAVLAAAAAVPADQALNTAADNATDAANQASNVLKAAQSAGSTAASITTRSATAASLIFTALSRGAWANQVVIDVDYTDYSDPKNKKAYTDTKCFNLIITDLGTGTVEEFDNVTMDSARSNYVVNVVNDVDSGSDLVSVKIAAAAVGRPLPTGTVSDDITAALTTLPSTGTILIKSDFPTGIAKINTTGVSVAVFAGETAPTSLAGLCRQLERKINLALKGEPTLTGTTALVQCVPSSSGKGIKITAAFTTGDVTVYDATLTFVAGDPAGLVTTLKLDAPVAPPSTSLYSSNVGRYSLGRGRAASGQSDPVLGNDGTLLPQTDDLIGDPADFTGLYALDKIDLFNLLSIPDATRAQAGNPNALDSNLNPNAIYSAAMSLCQKRRAFLLIDPPPEVNDVDSATDWKTSGLGVHAENGAAFFPRLRLADPLNGYQPRTFAPSGVVAGLFARIDANRGIWKAPAGTEATLTGVQGPVYKLNDAENGVLNPLGLNCFRNFPIYGNISWGSRTLVGSDDEGSEWKYTPVRRTALYIEESLYRGTKWVVFEPNDEPLWSQIRLNIGSFMHSLYRQGAFQGKTPREAYLVKCDKETTTQDDINQGIVNILVGFAPVKPAEFVIIKIQQLVGQIQA